MTEMKCVSKPNGEPRPVLLHLPPSKPINVSFTDIRLNVRSGLRHEKKDVLKGISGTFYSGELTAIMGPSGAGKSSLLNILTGFQVHGMSGRIVCSRVVKNERIETNGFNKKDSCYIMQDDQLNPLFTVTEIMTIAANLKLGNSLSHKAKKLIIEDILEVIGLGTSKYTRCGQLSGGQKKRLSIALELIDNRPVMFLDEPTTGLDSSTTMQLVSLLKGLARGGRNIVCTIHQPSASVFEMFDHVYIISEGNCVYQGSSLNIVPFLQSVGLSCPQYHNPADFMLDVVTGEFGEVTQQLKDATNSTSWRGEHPVMMQARVTNTEDLEICSEINNSFDEARTPSEWVRLWVLVGRCLIQLYRDWTITHLKMFVHLCVGILLGLLFNESGRDGSKGVSNVGYFFVTCVYLSYTSLMPALMKFPMELLVLKKEQFNNWYKLSTYFTAFLLTTIPVQMSFCLVYVSVSYYLTDQPLDLMRFVMFLTVNMFVVFISECYGLGLGTFINPVNGVFFGAIGICLMILMAGFLALLKHMPTPMYYLSFCSYLRYSMEGMVIAIYGYERENLWCPRSEMYCHYKSPTAMLRELDMENVNYWTDILGLVIIVIVSCVFSYVSLRNRVKSR